MTSRAFRGPVFGEPVRLDELSARHGGVLDAGLAERRVARIASVARAGADALAPVTARRYLRAAAGSPAALLVDASLADDLPAGNRWVHADAARALMAILDALSPPPPPDARHLAHVDDAATVHPSATIGPGAVILAGAVVGPGCRIEPNAVVYGGVTLGARVRVGAGAVLGRPGFRVAPGEGGALRQVPQLGGVVVEDDADIGALCTVDAGTLEPTLIGWGAKLDAHVHVGHNVVVGPGAVVAAQAGFAGSVVLGAGAMVGGQAGVADHVRVGEGARLAAKSGVIGDVPPGTTVAGYPAVSRGRWLRAMARLLRGGPDDRRK